MCHLLDRDSADEGEEEEEEVAEEETDGGTVIEPTPPKEEHAAAEPADSLRVNLEQWNQLLGQA